MTERFVRRLQEGSFAVTLEITPPKKPLPEVLRKRARMLGESADAINVIQRPGRTSSLAASIELLAADLEPVLHIANRGRSRVELAAEIAMAEQVGIRSVLCIRGDHDDRDREDTPKLRELVGMICNGLPEGLVGATANQYGSEDRVLRNLLPKLQAGVQFVQTQPVFEWEKFRALANAIKQRSPETFLVPMLMPMLSADSARSVGERLGVRLPEAMLTRLEQSGEAAGWQLFAEQLQRLHESPLADGIALMTREMDPPEVVTQRIAQMIAALRKPS